MLGRSRSRDRSRGHSSAQPWTPLRASTTRLFLRADLGHATADGGTVASVANQYAGAGAWGAAAQGTAANRPTYRASVSQLGNRPALEFDGTNDVLSGTCTLTSSTFQVFVVGRTLVVPANGGIFSLTKAATSDFNAQALCALYEASGPIVVGYRNNATANRTAPAAGAAWVASLKFDGSLCTVRVTGQSATTFVSTGAFDATGYQLAARWLAAVSNYTNVQLAEVVAGDPMSTADETTYGAYVLARYGVAL